MYQLYGHRNSGAAAIEAALELCQIPYRFIDIEVSTEAAEALARLNPLKQIPTLQLPDGSAITESAAILIHLGLSFPNPACCQQRPPSATRPFAAWCTSSAIATRPSASSTIPSAGW